MEKENKIILLCIFIFLGIMGWFQLSMQIIWACFYDFRVTIVYQGFWVQFFLILSFLIYSIIAGVILLIVEIQG